MDRLDAMSVLLRAVETGSLSGASRSLGMPLATVSRKISDLEAHLGTRLLIRTTRSLALTEAGAAYLTAARRILAEVAEAERAAAGEFDIPSGELVVTAPLLFGRLHILPVVMDFLAAYPKIGIRMPLSDRNLHLVDEHVDIAARIGALPDSGMIATRVGGMRTVVCASPDLLAAHGAPQEPSDLTELPCVNFEPFSIRPVWRFPREDVAIRSRLSVSTAEVAVAAAVRGFGAVRVLHYQCAEAVRDGSLRIILSDFEPAPQPVHLLHAARGVLPLKMRAFLDFVAPRLRERLASIG